MHSLSRSDHLLLLRAWTHSLSHSLTLCALLKEEKKRKRAVAAKRKRVGAGAADDDEDGAERKQPKERRGKTDKMLDEMGDATKYLAKLRRNRKHNKAAANMLARGGRKKSMFFKDAKPLLLDDTLSDKARAGHLE